MPVFPTFKRRQIVKGSKNEKGKEFHRLFVSGKKAGTISIYLIVMIVTSFKFKLFY